MTKALGAMRRGSFTIRDTAGGEADLSIIVLSGAANSLLDNVNRWRGQIGLAPLTATQLPAESVSIDSGPLHFAVVDLLGRKPGDGATVRIVGAILFHRDEAWFFKLTGPDALVAAEKPAFLDFLRTVRAAP